MTETGNFVFGTSLQSAKTESRKCPAAFELSFGPF